MDNYIYLQFAINKCLKIKLQNCRGSFPTKRVHRRAGNFVIIFFKIFFFFAPFQTEDHDSMMSWIAAIQANNNPDEDVRVFSCYFILLAY